MNKTRRKTLISIIHGSIFVLSSFILLSLSLKEELVLIDPEKIWVLYVLLSLSIASIIFSLIFNMILKKDSQKAQDIVSITNVIPFSLIIVLIINTFILFNATVVGGSMEPTFYNDEQIVVSKVSEVEKGDVVIICKPTDPDYLLIKRLVAKEGDTITVTSDGIVYVNGEVINSVSVSYKVFEYEDYTLKKGEYYCLGDNRGSSLDSRYYGVFTKEELRGKVVLRVSPFAIDFNK